MSGWIKDYRKELCSDVWMLPPLYHRVWQYLKYKVNHQDKTVPTKHGRITIKRGQTITSLRQIAEAVKWIEHGAERIPSPKTIREILNVLQNLEMVARESNTKGTVITVLNYDIYQGWEDDEGNTEETLREHVGPTNNNDNNDNNEKKKNKRHYAKFVAMKEVEHSKLVEEFGEKLTAEKIEDLNNWKGGKGKKTKDDYLTIRAWIRKDIKQKEAEQRKKAYPKTVLR